jgi:hypothetical protein
MPEERIGDEIKARAESLIDAASAVTTAHVSRVHRAALLQAVADDLDAAAHRAAGDGATAGIRVAWVAGRDRDRRIGATARRPGLASDATG